MTWLLAGVFLAPIVHWWIRRMNFWGVRTVIAGLVFAPGICVAGWGVWFVCVLDNWVDRWTVVHYLQGRGGLRCLAVITVIPAAYLGVCVLLEHFSKRADGDQSSEGIHVIEAWRPLIAIQMVLMAAASYLYSYDTLGDAVASDNFVLVKKRLNWNLEGLDPNNGFIVRVGSGKLDLYPLLPVAVKNGNYAMVKLLVKHGAEPNPRDWDDRNWTNVKNTLYFAVRNHDVEMIHLLIDLGVNPDQGIYPALLERDRGLLEFFLEEGASLEYALDVAGYMGWKQQKIDEYFAVYTPNTRGEAGQ